MEILDFDLTTVIQINQFRNREKLTKNDFCDFNAAANFPSVGSVIDFQSANSTSVKLDSTKARNWCETSTNRFNESNMSIK